MDDVNVQEQSTVDTNADTQQFADTQQAQADVGLPENWIESLDEDIRNADVLKQVRDIPGMAKMLVHAQRMVGKDKVPLPGPNATDEDWQAFFDSIGRPKSPEEYELVPPDDFPEDIPIDDKVVSEFMEQAHKAGLLPQQAQQIYQWYLTKARDGHYEAIQYMETAREQAENELKKEWGALYNQKVEKAQKAALHFLGDEGIKKLEASGLANDPHIIKALARIGESLSEDIFVEPDSSQFKTTAKAEIERILGDKSHPYHNADHPGHQAAVSRMQELFQQVHGK